MGWLIAWTLCGLAAAWLWAPRSSKLLCAGFTGIFVLLGPLVFLVAIGTLFLNDDPRGS